MDAEKSTGVRGPTGSTETAYPEEWLRALFYSLAMDWPEMEKNLAKFLGSQGLTGRPTSGNTCGSGGPEERVKPLAEKKPLATGLNRQYKEAPEPVEVVSVGWDGVERRKAPCAVCEARKAQEREYMRKYRAKK